MITKPHVPRPFEIDTLGMYVPREVDFGGVPVSNGCEWGQLFRTNNLLPVSGR